MNNPWGFIVTCRAMISNIWDAACGTRMRQMTSFLVLGFVGLIIYGIEGDDPSLINVSKLNTAIEISRFFETENRTLAIELENEQRRRRLAEQTINALASNVKEQDEIILDQNQQIAFLRQLLDERGRTSTDTAIRTFDIEPDYRASYFQLSAVLVRSGTDKEPFAGRLDLALSLIDANGVTFEHRPIFNPGALDLSFRYYHELQAVFPIPTGSEITNAQLVLLDKEGQVVVSRTLHGQI